MNDTQIEQEILAKGLTAPRVTPTDIEAEIASEHYFTAAEGVIGAERAGKVQPTNGPTESLGLLTFCVLVLRNGFTVTGESACASPKNFDAELGRKIARQNAVAKVWPLLGFRLRDRLAFQRDVGTPACLHVALEGVRTNAPIHRDEGDAEQAHSCERQATQIESAIRQLGGDPSAN